MDHSGLCVLGYSLIAEMRGFCGVVGHGSGLYYAQACYSADCGGYNSGKRCEAKLKRVMILGQPGSGKSTLARKLGAVTGLPVVHMDRLHWKAGWEPRDFDEKLAMTRAQHAEERWVFEGGFSYTWQERATRADTIIWLDVGLWRRIWRVLARFVRYYGQTRPDLPEGCPEGNWREMWIFLKWIWNTRRSARVRIKALLVEFQEGRDIVVMSTIPEVEAYLVRVAD